jgi:hypothetical protein
MNLRPFILAASALACLAAVAMAQNNTGAGGGGLTSTAPIQMFRSAGAHQQLTITSGAVVTLTVPAIATTASFTVENGSIRMLDDGVAPTPTLGNVWSIGPAYYGGNLKTLQFIAVSTTATLDVLYYINQ